MAEWSSKDLDTMDKIRIEIEEMFNEYENYERD